jgi:hypothetical protein
MAKIGQMLQGVEAAAPKSFGPLPAGDYVAIVTGDETKLTAAGDSAMQFEYTIIDGEFTNRKIWDYMNVGHSKPETQASALRDLKALCSACGVMDPDDTAELHDIPFTLKLGIKVDKETKDKKNSVQGYISMTGGAATAPAARPAAPAAPFQRAVAGAPPAFTRTAPPAAASAPAAPTAPARAAPPWGK